MEGTKFLNILKKHRYTLIGVPLFVIAITYVLVRKLPDEYESKATISAGIAEQSQQLLSDKLDLQQEKTNQEFTNLIQLMQMRTIFDQLSYKLILHDLTGPVPYRRPSKLMGYLNADARKHAIDVYTSLYNARQPLILSDNDQRGLNDVLVSMKYDYASLAKKMKIYRVENSDFINVEYATDSPLLSSVAVNTLCNEFISYYTVFTKENELKSVSYLSKQLEEKKDSLNSKMRNLEDYKIKNRVLNLSEEGKSLYTQIADYESRLEGVQKDIAANEGALRSIDNKFNSNDRQYMDSKLTRINQDILASKQQLNELNDAYIKSGFDSGYQDKINEQKTKIAEEINTATDKYILNPMSAKESLMAQKLTLEMNQELAKNSIKTIQDMLEKLNKKFDQLVPNEAVIQAYESDITVTSQEYLELLNKYNETNLQYNAATKVKLIETAGIGEKAPSKKILLVVISGIVSLIFSLLVLFIIFYFDKSIQNPAELADKTKLPVLGHLPLLHTTSLNLTELWKNNGGLGRDDEFKNQLRSVRFEIDNMLNGPAVLNITSLGSGEGKTLFALSLVSAYAMTGKKVLLIDGNFNNNTITEITKPDRFIEDYLAGTTNAPTVMAGRLVVLGNRREDRSLFELSSESKVLEKLQELKKEFDLVLIESAGMDLLNKSKEWLKVADKAVGIFEVNNTLKPNEEHEVDYLQTINNKFIGWVMNKVPAAANDRLKRKGKVKGKA